MGIIDESKSAKTNGLGFWRSKKFILLIVVIIITGSTYFLWPGEKVESTEKQSSLKEWTVKKDDIVISVEADGKVVAEDGVELSFGINDDNLEVTEVLVKEGDTVKKGDKIASVETESLELSLRTAWASYESALADYNDTIDGPTENQIADAQDKIESAEISLNQGNISLDKTKQSASESIDVAEERIDDAKKTVDDARENLDENKDELTSEDIKDAYENLVDEVKSININLDSILKSSDNILGIDDKTINDAFENVLGVKNTSTLNNAQNSYNVSKKSLQNLDEILLSLNSSSDYDDVDEAVIQTNEALSRFESHLYDMKLTLEATITSNDFSQSELNSFVSTISTNRSSINTKISNLDSKVETLDDAKEGLEDYIEDYDDALEDLEKIIEDLEDVKIDAQKDIENSESNLDSKNLSLNQAKRDYKELLEPLTDSELASAKSRLTSASVSLERARNELEEADLVSPIDGQIVELNYKSGDIIVDNDDPVAVILNNETLFVEVNIEEADVSKLEVGQKAVATFDALDELELNGEISFISLTSDTNNNGIVTYEVRVVINNPGEKQIREGMTVYVDFIAQETNGVLVAPVAAVRNVEGKPSVQLTNRDWVQVTTGFTDGKSVEIISGLNEGDKIIY